MELIASAGLIAAVSGGVFGMFKVLEETASKQAKLGFSAWLKKTSLSRDQTPTIHRILYQTFESFFGGDIFARKFIIRSLMMSIFGAFTLYLAGFLIIVLSFPEIRFMLFEGGLFNAIFEILKSTPKILLFLLLIVMVCCVIDYLSLCKTWLIIQAAKQTQNWKRFYALDISLTLLIAVGWTTIWIAVVSIPNHFIKEFFGIQLNWEYALNGLVTSLVPTFFLFSFICFSTLSKIAAKFMIPAEFLKSRVLNIDEKPFQSVGLIGAILVIFLVIAVIALANFL